jgi:hypothetical protein
MNTATNPGNRLENMGATALRKPALGLCLGLGALLAASVAVAKPPPQLTPVATGLNNPRGLAFEDEDTLYVAEAGLGAGDGKGGFGVGVGLTGSITKIKNLDSKHPGARRVVTGLVSVGTAERGPEVVGADGLSMQHEGALFVIMAESIGGELAADPTLDPDLVGQFGHLIKLRLHDGEDGDAEDDPPWRAIADVGSFNYAWTGAHQNDPWAPMGQFPDANPYAVLALKGHQYVVDAAANTLNEVRRDGTVRLLSYIPNPLFPPPGGGPAVIPISDAVPTCIAQGPDGFLYVGTLAFAANFARFDTNSPPLWSTLPKQSKVYRIDPRAPKLMLDESDVWAADLNPITGCGFGRDGSFYVTEYVTQESGYQSGDVVRIKVNKDGSAGARTALGVGALHNPNSFAAGRDGSIYVSNNSTSTAIDPLPGQVVRVNY